MVPGGALGTSGRFLAGSLGSLGLSSDPWGVLLGKRKVIFPSIYFCGCSLGRSGVHGWSLGRPGGPLGGSSGLLRVYGAPWVIPGVRLQCIHKATSFYVYHRGSLRRVPGGFFGGLWVFLGVCGWSMGVHGWSLGRPGCPGWSLGGSSGTLGPLGDPGVVS